MFRLASREAGRGTLRALVGDRLWGCRGCGVKPSEFYDERILTLPLGVLVSLCPECGWRPARGGYVATNDSYCRGRWGKDAKDVEAMPRKGGGPCLGPIVHRGAGMVSWLELLTGVKHHEGPAYTAAVVRVAEALGVDTSPITGPRRALSEAERLQEERERAERRAEVERRQREDEQAERDRRAARRLEASAAWDQAVALPGSTSPAWQYLQGRLGLWPTGMSPERAQAVLAAPQREMDHKYPELPESIRCVPPGKTLDFEYEGRRQRWAGPLLVARRMVRDEVLGIQVIPLALKMESDGIHAIKRPMPPPLPDEKQPPEKPIYGPNANDEGQFGVVMIPSVVSVGEPVADPLKEPMTLVLCEGIETGWAIHVATGWCVACLLMANGLRVFDLESIEGLAVLGDLRAVRVIIAGDHDSERKSDGLRTGHEAAWACARRLRAAWPRLSIIVAIPDEQGVWKKQAAVVEEHKGS